MKKSKVIGAALAILTMGCVFALDAKVVSVTGKVERQKGTEWVAVKMGEVIPRGSVISTGFKSGAEIQINDATVKLGALTRVTVEQLVSSGDVDETKLFMDTGKVSTNVDRTASSKRVNFKVSSPVATASVRGTRFDMSASGRVSTSAGLVAVAASTSSKASVASSNEVSENAPQAGNSTAQTSAVAVGGSAGDVPVYAGQKTEVSRATGNVTPPQFSASANATVAQTKTKPLSQSETSMSTVAQTVVATQALATKEAINPTASVSVNVDW